MRDWSGYRREYVTGTMSLRELASEKGISFSAMAKAAGREGWAEKRKRYGDKLETEILEAVRGHARREHVDMLKRLREIANWHIECILSALTRSRGVDARALRLMAATLRELTAVIRDLIDEPKMLDKAKMENAKGYLEALLTRDTGW